MVDACWISRHLSMRSGMADLDQCLALLLSVLCNLLLVMPVPVAVLVDLVRALFEQLAILLHCLSVHCTEYGLRVCRSCQPKDLLCCLQMLKRRRKRAPCGPRRNEAGWWPDAISLDLNSLQDFVLQLSKRVFLLHLLSGDDWGISPNYIFSHRDHL